MFIDQWLVKQLGKLFYWRYANSLGHLARKWQTLGEEQRLQHLVDRLDHCGIGVFIRAGVHITAPEKVSLGDHVGIGAGTIIRAAGGVTFKDFVLLGDYVVVATTGHPIGERYASNFYHKPVILEENVWVGANAIILPGVTIGQNSVIGAGAVVTRDIPANAVAVGVPAAVIREIDPAQQAIIDEQKNVLRHTRARWSDVTINI